MLVRRPKAEVNAADADDWRRLHVLPLLRSEENPERLARILLDHGADVSGWNHNGQTPLLMVCLRSNAVLASLLLERDADITETGTTWQERVALCARDTQGGDSQDLQSPGLFQCRDKRGSNILH